MCLTDRKIRNKCLPTLITMFLMKETNKCFMEAHHFMNTMRRQALPKLTPWKIQIKSRASVEGFKVKILGQTGRTRNYCKMTKTRHKFWISKFKLEATKTNKKES